jgi:dethiobiotin synthetase
MPLAPLLIVTGTGTGIGKTHVARTLLRASPIPAFGYKPIESGVGSGVSDQEHLRIASSSHVKHLPTFALQASLSPHLAAADEGVFIDWRAIESAIYALRTTTDVALLLELPGGLFTPVTPTVRNVDVIGGLHPTSTLLIAPDRLGVLHDVGATSVAATHVGVRLDGVVLVQPETPDASTGRNMGELSLIDIPVMGSYPRAGVEILIAHELTQRILNAWLG